MNNQAFSAIQKPGAAKRGFTLVELMIAVAIVGILAAIAVPNYRQNVIKGKRSEAQGALVAFANAMEQWRLQNNGSYCDAGGAGGADFCDVDTTNDTGSPSIFSAVVPVSGGTKTYDLTISAITAAAAAVPETPTTAAVAAKQAAYTLRATPVGSQAADGYLELKSDGTKLCEKASACLNGNSW